jgi:hypothetical protein
MEQESLTMIARLSTRAFLGPELCRNPEWLAVINAYSDEVWAAITSLNYWPNLMRPWINGVLPSCRKYRRTAARGQEILYSLAEQRRLQYQTIKAEGLPLPKVGDNIIWMDELAQGSPYDLAGAQFFMSLAGNPTASDVVTSALYELCSHPKFFEPLREEIRREESNAVWDKSFLDRLQLMDSFLREVMRLNPLTCSTYHMFLAPASLLHPVLFARISSIWLTTSDSLHAAKSYPEDRVQRR